MKSLTRIVSLPKHDNVICGRDLGEILEKGMVYEIKEFLGEIIVKKIGKSALAKNGCPSENSEIQTIITHSSYLLTEDEFNEIREIRERETTNPDV